MWRFISALGSPGGGLNDLNSRSRIRRRRRYREDKVMGGALRTFCCQLELPQGLHVCYPSVSEDRLPRQTLVSNPVGTTAQQNISANAGGVLRSWHCCFWRQRHGDLLDSRGVVPRNHWNTYHHASQMNSEFFLPRGPFDLET